MAVFRELDPTDASILGALTPVYFAFGDAGGLSLTTSTINVNGFAVATTANLVVTQINADYPVTITGSVGGSDTLYTVTPLVAWANSGVVATVEIDGLLTATPYDQTRTLTVGESYTGDHTATALGRMLQQFDGSGNLRALASSYTDRVQELEDLASQVLHGRSVDTAEGHRLDGIGQIVNVLRSGRNDVDYRLRIRAELAVLQSQGGIADLIAVLRLLLPGMPNPPSIRIDEYFPKAIYLRPRNFIVNEDASLVASMLRRAVSAGTYLQFIYTATEADDDDLFRFSDVVDTSETGSTHGFGNGTLAGAG